MLSWQRNAGSIVDRPLINTKWMLPNSTIVLSMPCGLLSAQIASQCGTLALFFKRCFTPCSMIGLLFSLKSGVSSLNLLSAHASGVVHFIFSLRHL